MRTPRCALLVTWLLLLTAVLPAAAHAQTYRLYLAPDGNDAAAGTSTTTALRSLAAAQQRLLEQRPSGAVDVVIAAGTYLRQSVQWTFTNGAPIRFIAASDAAAPPWFDGRGGATWFTLKGGGDAATRLTFTGLKVSNYWMAMDLGSSKRSADGNSGNIIRNMTFERIGGVHGSSSEAAYSFAAIRLQNSRDNRIEHNRFVSIENDTRPRVSCTRSTWRATRPATASKAIPSPTSTAMPCVPAMPPTTPTWRPTVSSGPASTRRFRTGSSPMANVRRKAGSLSTTPWVLAITARSPPPAPAVPTMPVVR